VLSFSGQAFALPRLNPAEKTGVVLHSGPEGGLSLE